MAARPPQRDDSEPDQIEFGIAALDARLSNAGVEFPATSDELVESIDATEIPCDASGNTLSLSEALSRVHQDRFENKMELLDKLHPVFEEERAAVGKSVFGRLRALVPF
ncbi:hypothetical protein [Haloprofundus salilacus]|uniref:hypothetical protein n=1 Tax=Haloprofundus salilacus TaxID=2876190 RepID=UPI001CCBDCC2|nr:hypothetical protein [Haloprofundus salilacus]